LNAEIITFHNIINETYASDDLKKNLIVMTLRELEQKLEKCTLKLDKHGALDMRRCCVLIAGSAIVSAYAFLGEDVASRRIRLQQSADEARRLLVGESAVNARYNVVVLGLTGVGKSSFINYLYGRDVRKTGYGRPVTTCFESVDLD